MEDRGEKGTPFDERAALEELDRLQREIDLRRAEREAAAERFEAFIRSFSTPEEPSPVEPARTRSRAEPPLQRAAPVVPVDTAPASSADPLPAPPTTPAPRRLAARTVAIWCGALLLAAGAVGLWVWRQQVPEPAATTSPATEPPAAAVTPEAASPGGAEPEPTSQPAPARPGAPAQLELEITTSRTVWMRVLADGQRVLERELPAGSRVPVTAGKTIVIRTGDAGAVQVSVGGGKLEPLGQEGQVMTRTFTLDAAERR